MDDRIRQLLKQLGQAINDSISESGNVADHIQRIRDEGYDLYVVLDATIGLGRADEVNQPREDVTALQTMKASRHEVQFRINVHDLEMLRGMGIDPTRRIKVTKRIESKSRKPAEE